MAAYLVAQLKVHDPALFAEYRERVPAIIARFGGRYIVRGGAHHVLEGTPDLHRVVMIEFPDLAAARAFYNAPDYAPLIDMRRRASTGDLFIVEGV
jgi:uncharacterized protein (DUF1330 family)